MMCELFGDPDSVGALFLYPEPVVFAIIAEFDRQPFNHDEVRYAATNLTREQRGPQSAGPVRKYWQKRISV